MSFPIQFTRVQRPALRRHVRSGRRLTAAWFAVCVITAVAVMPAMSHAQRSELHGEELTGKGFLGINMQALSDGIREGLGLKVAYGVLVSQVVDGSPAAEAGIREGDVIMKFDGKRVDSPEELARLVRRMDPGAEVTVELARDNKTETLDVTVGDRSDEDGLAWIFPEGMSRMANWAPRPLGVDVSEMNEGLAPYFGVEEGGGLLVLDVKDDSAADEAGVQSGDVIVEIDGKDVKSSRDIRTSMSKLETGDEFAITVIRNKKKVELKGEAQEWARAWRHGHGMRTPRVDVFRDSDDDLRKQVDELRREIDSIKEKLDES